MTDQPMKLCCYCKIEADTRPYGPDGEMVCFHCAMSNPERAAETARNFVQQMNACGDAAVIDGSPAGPYPLNGLRH